MKNHQHNHIIEQVPVDYYQNGVEKNIFQKIWHTNKLKKIQLNITADPKKILDVGCASGWFLSNISRQYPKAHCYGIDIYDKAITYGKKKYPHITFKIADAHRLPFDKETFDLIISTESLEHVDNPKDVLLEMKRVLKKNGRVIIELDSGSILFTIVWYLWRKFSGKVWDHSHLHSFTIRKLAKMIDECGFKTLKKERFNWGMAMVFVIGKR